MEASTVQQILDSAARAASSDDYASAESLLREAAHLQESSLGPQHPDLASTFNNLAVVCEKQNRLAEAGEFYHRAFSIASASLDAEHPLVLTSRENLDEFHRVHGRLDEPSTPSPFSVVEPAINADILTASPNSSRRLAVVIGAIAGIVLVGSLVIWLTGARSDSRTAEAKSVTSAATEPLQQTETENPVEKRVPRPSETRARSVVPTSTDEPPRIVEASLCQDLSTNGGQWQCAPASDVAEAGSLYFYTRIATANSTRVHHRWYRNGHLRQDVDLAIEANPSAGYRTYSRQRLDSGDWRVEAVTVDGMVLHEARVAIR
jgi:Protein of unknown function (DUF2914)/Tetratricopeptide repeat